MAADEQSERKPRGAVGGRFFLEEMLAEDESGELHRGLDLRTGTPTMVRIVRGGGSNARRERLLRDTRRATGVKHPGLANVLGIGQTDEGDIFVAAEALAGDRLSDRLTIGELFDEQEASEIATQIAHALAAAHDADVVHRLLRPSLVVLTYRGDETIVKVEGLGMPRPPSASAGDPEIAYSAPEQQRGETVGRRADVYSLGAMLYAMLTGEVPAPNAVPPGGVLAEVVAKCLAEDPKDRYVDTAALRAALEVKTATLPPRVPSKMPMAISIPPPASVPSSASPPSAPRTSSSQPPSSDAAIAEAVKVFESKARVSLIPLSEDGVPPPSAATVPPPAESSSAMAFVSSTRAPSEAPPRHASHALVQEPAWKTWMMHGPAPQRAGAAAALAFVLTIALVPWWLAVVLALAVGGGALAALRARP